MKISIMILLSLLAFQAVAEDVNRKQNCREFADGVVMLAGTARDAKANGTSMNEWMSRAEDVAYSGDFDKDGADLFIGMSRVAWLYQDQSDRSLWTEAYDWCVEG